MARGLHRLVEGDLAGMFDGQSTTTVDWSGPGIVVDLSAVLQSPAFSAIVVCAGAWLAQVVAAKDRQRIIVVDECWKAIRDAGFVAWGEETEKLSRAYGVQFVTIVQRISDLASQADDGTATAKRAQGFVTEAETKVTFNLSGAEARASTDVMDWTESETLLVPKLPRGRALWRVGEHGAIVQTILSRARHGHVRQQPGHAGPAMTTSRSELARDASSGMTRAPVKILAVAAGVCLFSMCALAGGAPAFVTDNPSPPAVHHPRRPPAGLRSGGDGQPVRRAVDASGRRRRHRIGLRSDGRVGCRGARVCSSSSRPPSPSTPNPVPAGGADPAKSLRSRRRRLRGGPLPVLPRSGRESRPWPWWPTTAAIPVRRARRPRPATPRRYLLTAAGYTAADTAPVATTDPGAA